ncbi:MAG: hypothetical protein ACKOW8_06015 [Flavobacteriales bacterium]
MKKFFWSFSVVAALAIAIMSCNKNSLLEEQSGVVMQEKLVEMGTLGSGSSCTPLIAGQNINAGSFCITDSDTNNDGNPDMLHVTYNTVDGWMLKDLHFWIGTTLSTMPQTNTGSPRLGLFPYKTSGLNATTYTFNIPFSVIGYTCPDAARYYFVAHAVVSRNGQTETAYAGGDRLLARGNWAMYNTIWISCVQIVDTETVSETAWARLEGNSTCFIDIPSLNANRWGWTNGPLNAGSYNAAFWAAAGQCNLANGTNVGNVNIVYNGSSATITVTTTGTNPETGVAYNLEEVHIYAGSAMIPNGPNGAPTVAPGQLGYNSGALENVTSHTATINNLSGPIYVAVHGVVDGFPVELD